MTQLIKVRDEPERIEKEGNFWRRIAFGWVVISSSDDSTERRRLERAWEGKMMESVKSETKDKVVKMEFTVTKMMRDATTSHTKHCFASSTQLSLFCVLSRCCWFKVTKR
jgi:hypothetical protein